MKNLLFCSVGRRAKFIQNVRKIIPSSSKIVTTDNSLTAPAIYYSDNYYIVPKITDANYIDIIIDICKRENIGIITTFIDPEIELLAKNRELFESIGVLVLAPDVKTAELCFDKFKMFNFLNENGINTVKTYGDIESFKIDLAEKKIDFPIFVKPRTGSGSVGARKIDTMETLLQAYNEDNGLIIQEFMDGIDLDVDAYIDTISGELVSIFSKRKIETKIGGASKTISFIDKELFNIVNSLTSLLNFYGPIDIDFFYKEGNYYLSEINPRFGGAYLHAFGCGVDFISLCINNMNQITNTVNIGNYKEDILMLMYDDVVITELKND